MPKIVNPIVTNDNKSVVDFYLGCLSSAKRIRTHYDEKETSSVCIFYGDNVPCEGMVTYATIGVSDAELSINGIPLSQRIEILTAGLASDVLLPNVLATVAFDVLKDGREIYPGAVFEGAYAMYFPGKSIRHALFVDPFLWPKISSLDLPGKYVTFLQMIGVSDQEAKLLEDMGYDSLTTLFEEKDLDIFDLNRRSIV